MWKIRIVDDPLDVAGRNDATGVLLLQNKLAHATISLLDLFPDVPEVSGERIVQTALADFVSRQWTRDLHLVHTHHEQGCTFVVEALEKTTLHTRHRNRRNRSVSPHWTPYMLERTDIWCTPTGVLHVWVRVLAYNNDPTVVAGDHPSPVRRDCASDIFRHGQTCAVRTILASVVPADTATFVDAAQRHVATAMWQERLRVQLRADNAVAFVADGSILPRKSGASHAPMASPPAIPFAAPVDSPLRRDVSVDLGPWKTYLSKPTLAATPGTWLVEETDTILTMTGLLIPRGVSLIVGGGYHGKSTILRCVAAGVYNKIPGDGREFCVTVDDAVTVRAEDGRYVNRCNVSAFIANLPVLPNSASDTVNITKSFSTGEASGSTSQAANVVEAMEMGASAFLVDEDVSAANFMARDGRMRALVMDESITPLLYRVNGLYQKHGISSVVVVGGVGDWLDVPDAVILMDKYVCHDATQKARSVSRQFSHGHVQYGGRGVVHRLNWESTGTPNPRRPTDAWSQKFDRQSTVISLLDGVQSLVLHHAEEDQAITNDEEEEEEAMIDLSRCEQLLGKKPQLYGCGLCVVWLLEASRQYPNLGLSDLLHKMDSAIDTEGLFNVVSAVGETNTSLQSESLPANVGLLIETLGCAFRPRRFEVGQALTRLRGIQLEELPVEEDLVEKAAREEEARKRQRLREIWEARRQKG